ncbi:hypothetical protein I317_02416 [Kwoniella heveanensis CBS 569]|nr:hypothetical protein I317_02416 [Kwoniella heveanensis CBS 569]
MVKFLVFGNNVCGNLDAANPLSASSSTIIDNPRVVSIEGDEVIFHSWCYTIIKENDRCIVRGIDTLSEVKLVPRRVIGFDRPVGFILQDGTVANIYGKGRNGTVKVWHDAVVSGLGAAYGVNDDGVYRFQSLGELLESNGEGEGIRLDHPLLQGNMGAIKLYATESRAFILASTRHLIEVVDLRSVPGEGGQGTELRLVEEVEGVGIEAFVPGSGNRAGVVTKGGEAWLLPARGDPELLQVGNGTGDDEGDLDSDGDRDGEEVRLMGVGADCEVLVTDRAVYVRGSMPDKS